MNFAFPGASWFLLLLPAVILLYFLRLRRREVLVSSTLLWSKVLEDRRVNSPFQRFRNNLLLLLQLLVLLLLIGALSQPERETVEVEGRTHILIFDVSASMAVEEEDGESRLSLALKQAQEYLAGIGTQERAVLIRFAQQAQAVTPVTGDHNLLLKALQGLKVRPAATRLHDAMELALSIAKNKDDAIAVIFSDGAFAAWDGEEIPLPVEFMRVGKNASNSGIVALSSRLDLTGPGRSQVFVEVKNFSEEEATGMLSILQQGELVRAAQSERIPAGGRWARSFDAALREGLIEVRWEPDGEDALDLDNRAWLEIAPKRETRLWHVGSSSFFLDDALASIPHLRVEKVPLEDVQRRLAGDVPPDVILWDHCTPETLPEGSAHLFMGALPPGVWEEEPPQVEFPPVISWDRTHPVNRFLSFGNLDGWIAEAWVLPPIPAAKMLLDSRGGGLIATFSTVGTRGIVVSFDLGKSRWPLNLSFPLFLFNALQYLTAARTGPDVGVRGEELLSLRAVPGVQRFQIRRPDGEIVTVAADPGGNLHYASTDELGAYRISWKEPGSDKELTRTIPVNLLSPGESNIEPRETLEIAGQRVAGTSDAVGVSRLEYWPWLLALALAFLLVEWYCYHRR
ncbi:MAG: VWA domain-containing protein [Planctomycetota bacterium]